MQAQGFWDDIENSGKVMKEVKNLKTTIEDFKKINSEYEDIGAMLEMAEEENDDDLTVEAGEMLDNFVREFETFKIETLLSGEFDTNNVVVTLHAGAGGTEAQDWAEMLMRMYLSYFANHNFTGEITNYQKGDTAGIKTVSFNVYGDFAYGYLKGETGIHRLVRVSPYNAQGKRMTSFASVFVCPLVDDSIEVNINPANITIDTFRSSGAGGQNVNKVESGVRLHYKFINPLTGQEDELVAESTESRDQPKNKEIAMQHLRSQLYELELEKRRQVQAEIENKKMPIGWGAQIRSYVFDDKRVKDHRTNYQTSDVNSVMNGNIDEFIKVYLMEIN
jgi:peptide chain release factor 2